MTADQIREKYISFFEKRGHKSIPPAKLVPQNDPTTLFTGSGMQPLLPYLLGRTHPAGDKLVDSQPSFRAEDIEAVGDNRHTTFFEMLGNWGLGSYFKAEQLPWFWEFLTSELKLDPKKLYVTVFAGDPTHNIPKDSEAAEIWQGLFQKAGVQAEISEFGAMENAAKIGIKNDDRIFYYDAAKNWWSRIGTPDKMPAGEPGGPDSEVFYDFGTKHDPKYGQACHPNCDCGRFLEIGNSVFMQYIKTDKGEFMELPQKNVDFGGGLERLAAAVNDDSDIFKIDIIWPIVEKLETLSGKKYKDHVEAKRVIADHLRAAVFLAHDGVVPSNKTQGYVLRRLVRRAVRHGLDLGLEQNLLSQLVPVVADIYAKSYVDIKKHETEIAAVLDKEEKVFRQTLKKGLRVFNKIMANPVSIGLVYNSEEFNSSDRGKVEYKKAATAQDLFSLYDTFGFPLELIEEEASKHNVAISNEVRRQFADLLEEQRERSRTAAKGMFKGGLADHSQMTTKYHTATHLMYRALKEVLGDQVVQRGANITDERIRFDFSHPAKLTDEEIKKVEAIVNQKIAEDLPVQFEEMATKEALSKGAYGAFRDRYGDKVKVYGIGEGKDRFSFEICGGPHVQHTGQLAEGGKQFKIVKEESSSAGVRRIKAVLQ